MRIYNPRWLAVLDTLAEGRRDTLEIAALTGIPRPGGASSANSSPSGR